MVRVSRTIARNSFLLKLTAMIKTPTDSEINPVTEIRGFIPYAGPCAAIASTSSGAAFFSIWKNMQFIAI
ncbi:MAG: hypothetical protein BGP14_04525 [Sphingobacteriales bacterium 44-15]|nr:MAG: hypothetical protein BGP14_04525 [Sphingobacteriales bacterium 44-15]